ncbi:GTP-binding protein RHO3 [Elaphomyces granulatus]
MGLLCGHQRVVQRKMVLLGDGACGKTSALNVFTRGFFPTVYEPTVFDLFIDSVHLELSLWDTAGQEEFDRLRSLSYEDTHVIMLCFSVDSQDSYENVSTKWISEIQEHCPGVKMVLAALKCDLRTDEQENNNPSAITFDQGLEKAKEIGAVKYLECSAVLNRGIRETFYEAAKVALEVKPAGSSSGSRKCVIV